MSKMRIGWNYTLVLAYFDLEGNHIRTRFARPNSGGRYPIKSLHRFKCKDLTTQCSWNISQVAPSQRETCIAQISAKMKELKDSVWKGWSPPAGNKRGMVT